MTDMTNEVSEKILNHAKWITHPMYKHDIRNVGDMQDEYSDAVILKIAEGLGIDTGKKPKSAPTPAPTPTATPDATHAITELVAALTPPAVDEESINRLVDKKLADVKPVQYQIKMGGKQTVELKDEHVHPAFEKVLRLANQGLYPMLVGEAGTGKTHMAHQVAKALDRPFASISVTAGMSESQLSGWLIPIEEGGRFVYVPSDFVKMYEQGGVFLVDEMDAGDPNTFVFLNQALANGGFFIPQRHENPYVKKHDDFVMIGAANTFGQGADPMYTARERLDAATLDRFEAVVITYDETFEKKVAESEVFRWGRKIRQKIKEHNIRRVFSTRKMIAYTKLLRDGMDMDEIEETYFTTWSEDEKALVA